jgi:hypothetical protein
LPELGFVDLPKTAASGSLAKVSDAVTPSKAMASTTAAPTSVDRDFPSRLVADIVISFFGITPVRSAFHRSQPTSARCGRRMFDTRFGRAEPTGRLLARLKGRR